MSRKIKNQKPSTKNPAILNPSYFFSCLFTRNKYILIISPPLAHPSTLHARELKPSGHTNKQTEETNVFGQKHDATGVEMKISWQNVITKSKRFTS